MMMMKWRLCSLILKNRNSVETAGDLEYNGSEVSLQEPSAPHVDFNYIETGITEKGAQVLM